MSYVLPLLPYDYDALEPYIDKKTMEIHYTKHHQSYIDNANFALTKLPKLNHISADKLITILEQVPEDQQNILRNNVGGHVNHSLFWKGLKKNTILRGELEFAIEHDFGSLNIFKELFMKTALARFGSGWVWLVKQHDKLSIVSTANQDNPLMGKFISGTFGYPILGLDLWEHAYYLSYQNRRIDYVKAFWNIVNWDEAYLRFNVL